MQITSSLLKAVKGWKPCEYIPPAIKSSPAPNQSIHKAPKKVVDRLSNTARLLLVHLERLARQGALETTKASLGGWLNRCRRAVRYALAELENAGLIRSETTVGPLGLFSGLKIWVASAFNPAEFYANAEKRIVSGGAKLCTTSTDSYILTLQRKALNNIKAQKRAKNRLEQLRTSSCWEEIHV